MKKDNIMFYIGAIGIVATLASANLAVYLQTQQAHKQVIKNINVLNCINRLRIGAPLSQAKDQYNADWNARYLTNYYNLVWADIVQEFGTTTLNYVTAVNTMENVNTVLDRIDRLRPQGTERITAFQDVATGVNSVNSMFDSLNINDTRCIGLL